MSTGSSGRSNTTLRHPRGTTTPPNVQTVVGAVAALIAEAEAVRFPDTVVAAAAALPAGMVVATAAVVIAAELMTIFPSAAPAA